MFRDVVCISYASGAGGEEISRLVAERLGFAHVDEEIVARAAARGGVAPDAVTRAERRPTPFAGLLEHMDADAGRTPAAPPPGPEAGPRGEEVAGLVRDAIREVAAGGNVVIAAHAASYAVAGARAALRVLVTAPAETRAQRLAALEGLDDRAAARAIRRSDANRADYLKRFYGIAQELPVHYDLLVNTRDLSVEQAASLIVQASTEQPPARAAGPPSGA